MCICIYKYKLLSFLYNLSFNVRGQFKTNTPLLDVGSHINRNGIHTCICSWMHHKYVPIQRLECTSIDRQEIHKWGYISASAYMYDPWRKAKNLIWCIFTCPKLFGEGGQWLHASRVRHGMCFFDWKILATQSPKRALLHA